MNDKLYYLHPFALLLMLYCFILFSIYHSELNLPLQPCLVQMQKKRLILVLCVVDYNGLVYQCSHSTITLMC